MEKNELIKQSLQATKAKRKNQILKKITFKVNSNKLNSLQKEQIKMLFVMSKWLYNSMLAFSQNNNLNNFDLKNDIIQVKDKYGNLIEKDISKLPQSIRQCIQNEILNSFKALKNRKINGAKIGRVRFKNDYKVITFKQYGVTHSFKSNHRIKLQGIKGTLYLYGIKQLNDSMEFANASLINKPDGLYVSLITFQNKKDILRNGKQIGLDFGCSTSITTSEGEKINIKIRETERLKKLQRLLSKKQKGSKNFYKVKNLIDREYQKIYNRKSDIANKLVNQLSKYEVIVMQDEDLKSWHKTNSKSVQNSCLGTIKEKLSKLDNIIILNRYLPTTKLCTNCGRKLDLKLSDRKFICDCGIKEDRDIHAANNMLWFYNHKLGLEQSEVTPLEIEKELSTSSISKSKMKEA